MSFVTKSPRNLSESSESPAKALTNLSTAIQTTKELEKENINPSIVESHLNPPSSDSDVPNLKTHLKMPFKSPDEGHIAKKLKENCEPKPLSKNIDSQLSQIFDSKDSDGQIDASAYIHNNFEFLKPSKIKDKQGNLASHPEYDPKTLFVPPSFLDKQTPTMKQWWNIKSDYLDTIIFFKLGKFYETFHMDADVCVKELDLIYMRGEHAHAGFPEISFPRYADVLMQKGYSIARVEQTETPQEMKERLKTSTKKSSENCIRRSICQVSSQETRTFNPIESAMGTADNETAKSEYTFATQSENKLLMAICGKDMAITSQKQIQIGACLVDTAASKVIMTQFFDDNFLSRLRTLISTHDVGRILYEKSSLSPKLNQLIKHLNCKSTPLRKDVEFPSQGKEAIKRFLQKQYFEVNEASQLPENLRIFLDESDVSLMTPSNTGDLALKCLGAIQWYLEYSKIDNEVFSMKNFNVYTPSDDSAAQFSQTSLNQINKSKYLILDSQALLSVQILHSMFNENDTNASLFSVINFCQTSFGKRMLLKWVSSPSADIDAINSKSLIISALADWDELDLVPQFRNLPDFERLISIIHQTASKSSKHPENAAVMFCESTISKRKTNVFLTLIDGFSAAMKIINGIKDSRDLKSCDELQKILDAFPDYTESLQNILNSFDAECAENSGSIIPKKGLVKAYDEVIEAIDELEIDFDDFLISQQKKFKCPDIVYGTGTNKYNLEFPEKLAKNLPDSYLLTSQKKGYKRYLTDELKKMIEKNDQLEREKNLALNDSVKALFSLFMQQNKIWTQSWHILAILDCYVSLAKFSRGDSYQSQQIEFKMCQPEFMVNDEISAKPMLEIKNSFHPQLLASKSDLVSNDILMNTGDFDSTLMVLTGPNMGGKSTLMRQAAQLIVLAQMGCRVPAEKMIIGRPFDRLFTRIGASDSLLSGQSTFMVEMNEMSAILKHATENSFVIVDELGRGTSTYDGASIAKAVANHLSVKTKCLTLFSTHYHDLVDDLHKNQKISYGHMDCVVNDDGSPVADQERTQNIIFLYKLISGTCPKSYGFNAARLANLPQEIIKNGIQIAECLEKRSKNRKKLAELMKSVQVK